MIYIGNSSFELRLKVYGKLRQVLAVDDDHTAGLIYEAIGKRYGFDVVIVSTCADALAAINTAQFDLILMDWRLPDLDGMECTRMIRSSETEHGKNIAIIAVTAYAMNGDREKCLSAAVDDYLSKPFNMDELNRKIQFWQEKCSVFPSKKPARFSVS